MAVDDYQITLIRQPWGAWVAKSHSWLDDEETDEWNSPESALRALADMTGESYQDLMSAFGLTA